MEAGRSAIAIGDFGGDTSSKAFDVSADGNVIVGIGFSSFGGEAFDGLRREEWWDSAIYQGGDLGV